MRYRACRSFTVYMKKIYYYLFIFYLKRYATTWSLISHKFCCVNWNSRRTFKQKARRSTLSTLVPCSVSFAAVAVAAATATACCLLFLLLLFQRTRTSCSKSSSHRRLLFVLFASFGRCRSLVVVVELPKTLVCATVYVVVVVCVFVCVCN